jgi:hypothetical protein
MHRERSRRPQTWEEQLAVVEMHVAALQRKG